MTNKDKNVLKYYLSDLVDLGTAMILAPLLTVSVHVSRARLTSTFNIKLHFHLSMPI